MDPLSAVSLAASLVAFLDFGSKLISDTLRIYKSVSGSESRSVDASTIASDLAILSGEIETKLKVFRHDNRTLTPSEEKLAALCRDCQSVTSKIHGALDDVKDRGSEKIDFPNLNGVLRALRAVWSHNRIKALEENMSLIRQQIVVAVLVCIWEEARSSKHNDLLLRERLDRVLNAAGEGHPTTQRFVDELADLPCGSSKATEKSRKGVVGALESYTRPYELEMDLELRGDPAYSTADQHLQRVQSAVLDNLNFDGMDNRKDAIPAAHQNTFKWIFSGKTVTQSASRPEDTIPFTRWLEEDVNKIFWITGKPGSGKSTLMKYIGQHASLERHLKVWSRGLPLLCPAFYFWSAGNDLQKSLQGLLRTILHQCLLNRPDLIPRVVPRRWWVLSVLGTNIKIPSWSLEELKKAIHALAAENAKTFRLAFFIDGLDEFSGDHESVTNLIWEISNKYGVKFCVASRRWNVFADSFRQEPTLMMQDLTKGDIAFFIRSEFHSSPGFQELHAVFLEEVNDILQDVEKKAQGVFLWVNLVVRSLIEIVREEPRLHLIRQTLSNLPTDLELLYNAIWATIDAAKIGSSSKLFQLAMALDVGADGQAGQPSCDAVTMWFAFEADTPEHCSGVLDVEKERSVKEIMTRILRSLTRGILEVSPMGRVNFLHRTARDWIQKSQTWDEICSRSSPGFDSKLAATEALALEMTRRMTKRPKDLWDFSTSVAKVLCYAGGVADTDITTPKLVKVLDRFDKDTAAVANSLSYPVGHFGTVPRPIFEPGIGYSTLHWSMVLYRKNGAMFEHSLLDLAALFAILPYVKAKVPGKKNAVRPARNRIPLIGAAALGSLQDSGMDMARVSWYLLTVDYSRRLETVRFLLQNGANPKHISGWRELAHGDVQQFFVTAMMKPERQAEGDKYWKDLSALVAEFSGLRRSLKAMLRTF